MSNFDNEIQDNQIEVDLSINRQIFSFLQQGIDQINIFMGGIPPLRNDDLFEDGDNQIYFSLPRSLMRDRPSPRYFCVHRFREKPQNIQNYLQKRTDPIQNNQFDPKLPHIKVSQLRNMSAHHHYFINEFGQIGMNYLIALQIPKKILILLTYQLADNIAKIRILYLMIQDSFTRRQSDIVKEGKFYDPHVLIDFQILIYHSNQQMSVSRIHCKIIYNDYFRKQQVLDSIYAKTLELIKLPAQIKYKISQFLENPKIVQIQDLGSICGTYLRIFRQEPCVLKEGHKFSIGSDTFFNILLNHNLNPNLKDIDDEWYSIIKHLSSLKSTQKHEIHLSDLLNQISILEPLESIKRLSIKDLYTKLREYSIPILIVKFQGHGVYINRCINLFVGKTQTDTNDFFVGRGSENNIKISSNTISRKQCRIKYSQKLSAWIINDGYQDRDSANGTWISLQTTEQSEQKAESNLIELHHNDEIKISDSILKLELFQGTKQGFGNIINKFLRD